MIRLVFSFNDHHTISISSQLEFDNSHRVFGKVIPIVHTLSFSSFRMDLDILKIFVTFFLTSTDKFACFMHIYILKEVFFDF